MWIFRRTPKYYPRPLFSSQPPSTSHLQPLSKLIQACKIEMTAILLKQKMITIKMAKHLQMIAMLVRSQQRVLLTKLRPKHFNPFHLTQRTHHYKRRNIQNLITAKMLAAPIVLSQESTTQNSQRQCKSAMFQKMIIGPTKSQPNIIVNPYNNNTSKLPTIKSRRKAQMRLKAPKLDYLQPQVFFANARD